MKAEINMLVSISRVALPLIAGGVLLATSAQAGTIILRNTDMPNVCGLEVSVGPNAPDAPVQQFGDLQAEWETQFDADKICFRFSNPPEACGGWTPWKCCEAGAGEQLCVLE
jgi:hypothetical protein